jgi:glycerophosphoryl diester phosphodiesterase
MRLTYFCFGLLVVISMGCTNSKIENKSAIKETPTIDFQGHRGCRGLMPENTIPAFKKALDLGVETLEMDVVITHDKKVILSHEPWFSHEIALKPDGGEISLDEETSHRIYAMNYDETKAYDVGLKPHPRFPEQKKISINKPLLTDVIKQSEYYAVQLGRSAPFYNIETKCRPEGDSIFHPAPEEFVDLLVGVIQESGIEDRVIVQSFDIRTLQTAKSKYPDIKLALLIENSKSPQENIETLGFTPDIYSPDYALVDDELISFSKEKGMKVIPWTVNETEEMEKLIALGVDGIITDFPDRIPSGY